ncbi:MAG: substrate-binding domain-containing protein [Bacteriovoracaceae bacterium]
MIPFLVGVILFIFSARAEVAVIVNSQNPATSITRTQLADFFLKKVKLWPNGTSMRFFDRMDSSDLRKDFLHDYVRKSQRDVELYWIGQKLYSGHSAPSQISSDNLMEIMVSRFPGAIGYVSKDFVPTRPVKKIPVTEE